eukprot:1163151_1
MGNSQTGKVDQWEVNDIKRPKITKTNDVEWMENMDSKLQSHALHDTIQRQTQGINSLDILDPDVMDIIYAYVYSLYQQTEIEISLTDYYIKDKQINIFNRNGQVIDSIDFNKVDLMIKQMIDTKTDYDHKSTQFHKIMYSKQNGHVWIMYSYRDEDGWRIAIFYTYLTMHPSQMGVLCFKTPLVLLRHHESVNTKGFMIDFCSSSGDLYRVSHSKMCIEAINVAAIEYNHESTQDIVESNAVEWVVYETMHMQFPCNLIIISGAELNMFFGLTKFYANKSYVCCLEEKPFLQIYIFDVMAHRLVHQYFDEGIKTSEYVNEARELFEPNPNDKTIQLYKLNADKQQIVVICYDLMNPFQMYSKYSFYAYHINLFACKENEKVNHLTLIKTDVYGEGGFLMDYILDAMDYEKQCVWYKVNGRGIGYNVIGCLELDRNTLTVVRDLEALYDHPVDKKMIISLC